MEVFYKILSGTKFDAAGAHRVKCRTHLIKNLSASRFTSGQRLKYRTYVVKKTSGMFFTIHVLVNGPTGYMKKFSRNFFHDSPTGKIHGCIL